MSVSVLVVRIYVQSECRLGLRPQAMYRQHADVVGWEHIPITSAYDVVEFISLYNVIECWSMCLTRFSDV